MGSGNFVRVEKMMADSWGIAGQRGASPGAIGLVGPRVFPGMSDQSVTAGCVALTVFDFDRPIGRLDR